MGSNVFTFFSFFLVLCAINAVNTVIDRKYGFSVNANNSVITVSIML